MIPKKLHFIWISERGIEIPEEYSAIPDMWGSLNPGWEIQRWGGPMLEEFIGDCYAGFLETWRALDKAVMRSDLARLLLLHHHGGIYLDYDLRPMGRRPGVLDRFLSCTSILNKYITESRLPDVPSEDFMDLSTRGTVLSRENCRIDRTGHGVANNMVLSKPGQDWIIDFCDQQKSAYNGLVLDFLGPWALTRFWRTRMEGDPDKTRNEATIIPPHYFIWEDRRMTCDAPDYTISKHTGENTWGDKTKKDFWRV